jgi:peptidoglycan biosynthesis protein MviN/MurJ (putative lipid II flippase)
LPCKLLLLLLPMIFNLWGILHLWRREYMDQSARLIWLCVCVFLPVAGGLAYFFRVWSHRRARTRVQRHYGGEGKTPGGDDACAPLPSNKSATNNGR